MQVRTDKLQLLFHQSFLATFGSVGGALALSWLQRDLGNHEVIVPWLITLCVAGMVRLGLFWAYNRSALQCRTPARWESVYWATLVFTAGTWGLGAFLLMSRDNLLSQAITLFFAIGMAGSAISAYSAYRSMTLVAVGLVLLPTTLWLLTEPGSEQRVLAFTTLAFSAFVVRATGDLSGALQSLLRLRRELEIEHRIASTAARTDELTGLNNLRAFREQADTMFTATRRNGLPLCALLVDIDHFKQINDTHGHAAGDRVLQAVARGLKTALREADLCGRLGARSSRYCSPARTCTRPCRLQKSCAWLYKPLWCRSTTPCCMSPSASGWPRRVRPVRTSPPCWPRPMRPCTTPNPMAVTGCTATPPPPTAHATRSSTRKRMPAASKPATAAPR
ncbi:diguanylate cyclase (GGDEF) domain-containing protein [Paenacidovorax caeni]|uniref:diguanylate cyclase n=1 Tax=Paenacidovorax caeni TaxID=343013 RepID=A0A1I7KNB4_9BURK|nr:diguanylate cyclase (GGDEF) domain-containing protein [Paenacidovorax caeni]